MGMQDKLTPKKPNYDAEGAAILRVSPPDVRVTSPKVDVKVESPQLNMDSSAFADALESLAIAMNQISQQQARLLAVIEEHHAIINRTLERNPDITVEAPKVNLPPRPREFDVVFVEDDDGVVGMKIRANLPD